MHLPVIVKEHPVLSGLAVVASGYLVYRIWSGGSKGGATGVILGSNNDTAAATALQTATLQNQAQIAGINASVSENATTTAAQVQVAQLQAGTAQNNDNLSAQTSQVIAGLQAQTAQVIATLQASVANNQTNAQVQETAINDAALVQVALAPYTNITYAQAQQLQNEIGTVANVVNNVGNTLNVQFNTNRYNNPAYSTNVNLAAGVAALTQAQEQALSPYHNPIPGEPAAPDGSQGAG